MFGDFIAEIAPYNLNYKTDNLALVKIDNDEFPGIIQTFTVENKERVQSIACFNDFTHLYTFGKEPITYSIQGFTLKAKDLLDKYSNGYRAYKKTPVKVITLNTVLEGYCISLSMSINADTSALVNFNMIFITTNNIV